MCYVLGREEARAALLTAFDAYMRYAFPKVHAAASQSVGCHSRDWF